MADGLTPFQSALDAAIATEGLPWLTAIEHRQGTEMLMLRCIGTGHERGWSRPPPPEEAEALIVRLIPPRPEVGVGRARAFERAAAWEQAAEAWLGVAWLYDWWSDRPGETKRHRIHASEARQRAKKLQQHVRRGR